MNINSTVAPKSDQMNADDLITGPRTITITNVEAGASAEQPVCVRFEGDERRPYKPGKSMRRVLLALWGAEADAWVGRRLTLFCDPEITFGPDKTGGIRISHASDIPRAVTIALTVKKGKRKPFTVEPLARAPVPIPSPTLSDAELTELVAQAQQIGPEKAKEGTEALMAWGATLKAPVKVALRVEIAAWKVIAEQAGKATA